MPSMVIYVVNGSKHIFYNFHCASKSAILMMKRAHFRNI